MSKAGTPFKMKGSPFKRNFGIGASPMKKGLWETLTGKKFKETDLGKDITAAGEQIQADVKRAGEVIKTGKATTPRKPAPKKGKGPKTLHEKKMEKKEEAKKFPSKKTKRSKKRTTGKIDWSKAPKMNTQARVDWYAKHNLAPDATTKLK